MSLCACIDVLRLRYQRSPRMVRSIRRALAYNIDSPLYYRARNEYCSTMRQEHGASAIRPECVASRR